ncbi:MAG: hypothetical protein WBO00_12575 [Steroidobacteraceae bacterium]
MTRHSLIVPLLLLAGAALADDVPAGEPVASAATAETRADAGPKKISGMSILGNQEAPKSLVIVPWKSSEIGDSIAVSTLLDDSRRPVDKDVFMRELGYYEIRSQ